MLKRRMRVAATSLTVGFLLFTTLAVSPAYAGDKVNHVSSKKFVGQHMAIMTGFTGSSPSVVAHFVEVKRRNGSAFLGTQRWLDCGDNRQGCAQSKARWTEPEKVVFVRTAPNTYVLRSNNGMGQLTFNKEGVVKAYFIGAITGLKKLRNTTSGSGWEDAYTCGWDGMEKCPPPESAPLPPPPADAPVAPTMDDPDAPPPPPPS